MTAHTEFKETEFAPLPADWAVHSIAESCYKPEYGYTATAIQAAIGPKFLRITDIQEHRVDWQTVPYCRYEKDGGKYQLRPGDILFARIGATTGKTFLVRDCPDAIYASYLIRVRAHAVDPAFLYYFCNSEMYWHQINAHKSDKLKGGISGSLLAQIRHCSPPLDEQRAMAAVLSKILVAVELQDKIVATLKELKAATMAKLFHEGLCGEPLKQTEIGEIPESWQIVRLGDYCRISSGGTPARDVPEYWNGDIPWVKTTEIDYRPITGTDERITKAGLQNSSAKLFPRGTLLMAMYGQGITRGKVALLEIEAATNQACAALSPDERLDSGYLYAFCASAYNRIRELGHGANQKNLSADIIREIRLPVPSNLEEQREIYGAVRTIESRLQLAAHGMDALKSLFSSMLHLLMTGEIRLPGFGRKPNLDSSWFKPEDVWEFVGRLVRKFDPERVILFGSRAWETPRRDSDVDLLVVMEFAERPVDMAVRIGAECDDRFPMDLIVRRPAEVQRRIAMGDPFFKQILRDGLVLHERVA